ncbi:MAG: ribosome silencing factor [Myxococcales bacterium]
MATSKKTSERAPSPLKKPIRARPRLRSSHEEGPKPRRLAPTTSKRLARPTAASLRRQGKLLASSTLPAEASEAARAIATAIATSALEKKAVALEVVEVAGKVDYADFLVIMTGRSDRHVSALAAAIEEALRQKGTRPRAVEGLPNARWVLMDYGDVVVHVFQEDARSLYDLDGLWMDARRIPVPHEPT